MLKVTEEKNVAFVSLNRPEVRNSFHPHLIEKITTTFRTLSARKDLRAVVLSGEGKVFCAGADLNWMKEMVLYNLQKNQEDAQQLFQMFEAVWNCPVPVVGLVHGAAFGGALGLVACCDYVIAEEKTKLCFSEVRLGLVPAVISTFILRKCPTGVMAPLMLTGKIFTPKEIVGSGLIHDIVPESHLAETLAKVIQYFNESGPEAVRDTKKLTRVMRDLDWNESQKETCQVIAQRRVSVEGQEGLQAFLDKRDPTWKVQNGN
jgi:methylglutaconyl-CoA hydratase